MRRIAIGFISRFGRRHTLVAASLLMALGALCTTGPLVIAVIGLALFTAGFFAAHSTASGWVGALATHDRAEASSLYVFCYYMGSTILGAFTGWTFGVVAWWGFALILAGLGALATLIAANISD